MHERLDKLTCAEEQDILQLGVRTAHSSRCCAGPPSARPLLSQAGGTVAFCLLLFSSSVLVFCSSSPPRWRPLAARLPDHEHLFDDTAWSAGIESACSKPALNMCTCRLVGISSEE